MPSRDVLAPVRARHADFGILREVACAVPKSSSTMREARKTRRIPRP